jgi:hypothetical protein
LRSGELPAKVRRAFPATSDISGEFRFHSEVCLVVLFTGTSFFSRIHHPFVVSLIFFLFSGEELPWMAAVHLLRRHPGFSLCGSSALLHHWRWSRASRAK